MSSPRWIITLINKTFGTRFLLARLTRVPLIGKLIDQLLFAGDDIIYLPTNKVVTLNRQLTADEREGSTVLPSEIVHHFVEQAGYHWIMNFCICRKSDNCQDHPIELGCLFLGKAVLDINPEMGRLVSKQEAHHHLQRCRDAGLVHLIGRNKLDSVWLNVRPGRQLLTICNCCPCCCLWKMLPDLSPHISRNVTKMPGVTVEVLASCNGCGKCTTGICFVNAIRLENDRAVINNDCRGCGRCISVCPNHALQLTIHSSDFVRESIDRISGVVNIQ